MKTWNGTFSARKILTVITLSGVICLSACTNKDSAVSSLQLDPKNSPGSFRREIKPGDLVRAVAKKDINQVETLIAAGADVNENVGTPGEEITPLLAAIALGHETIAVRLVEKGAVQYPSFQGFAAKDFSRASLGDKSSLTKILIQKEVELKK